jgi:hypothetical protein
MNTPYKKQINANGEVANPIKGIYKNEFPNRKTRRMRPEKFKGNGKNFSLTVTGKLRYSRNIQEIILADGSIKRIRHYVLRNNIEKCKRKFA